MAALLTAVAVGIGASLAWLYAGTALVASGIQADAPEPAALGALVLAGFWLTVLALHRGVQGMNGRR